MTIDKGAGKGGGEHFALSERTPADPDRGEGVPGWLAGSLTSLGWVSAASGGGTLGEGEVDMLLSGECD